jgi:hypothetical protein
MISLDTSRGDDFVCQVRSLGDSLCERPATSGPLADQKILKPELVLNMINDNVIFYEFIQIFMTFKASIQNTDLETEVLRQNLLLLNVTLVSKYDEK